MLAQVLQELQQLRNQFGELRNQFGELRSQVGELRYELRNAWVFTILVWCGSRAHSWQFDY